MQANNLYIFYFKASVSISIIIFLRLISNQIKFKIYLEILF